MDYDAHTDLKETARRDAARLSSDRHAVAALTLLNKVDRKTAMARRKRNIIAGYLALLAVATTAAALLVNCHPTAFN